MPRLVLALAALVLGAFAPAFSVRAQPVRAALIDSARRLDSLATALNGSGNSTPVLRARAARVWAESAALYGHADDHVPEGAALRKAGNSHPSVDTAAAFFHAAVHVAQENGDRAGEGKAYSDLGKLLLSAPGARLDSARAVMRKAVGIAREVGSRWVGERARVFTRMGVVLQRLDRLDSAEAYYREGLSVALAEGDSVAEANALGEIGRLFVPRGDLDSALVYFHAALRRFRSVGDREDEQAYLGTIGNALVSAGRNDSALVYLRESLALSSALRGPPDIDLRILIANVLRELGLADSALEVLRAAVVLARESTLRSDEAWALGEIGRVFVQHGRYDSTVVYFQHAIRLFRAVEDRGGEMIFLHNLGGMYGEIGMSDSALTYLSRSLALARELDDRRVIVGTLSNMSVTLQYLGRADSALVILRNAERVARALGDPYTLGLTLENLGTTLSMLGRRDSAFAPLQESYAIFHRSGHVNKEAEALSQLGELHAHVGRADSALAAYQQALALARRAEALETESVILRQLGDLHTLRGARRDLARAVAYYDSAAAARARMLATTGADQRRVSFTEMGTTLFERWALAWLARRDDVGAEASVLAALAVVERGRAQALLELLREAHDSVVGSVPASRASAIAGADLVAEGRTLVNVVRRGGRAALSHLVTADTAIAWLVLPSGEVRVARQALARDSLATLVADARASFGVDETGVRGTGHLERAVTRARRSRRGTRDALTRLAAVALPGALLRDLPPDREVVIVPHGPLALVPFAALPPNGADGPLGRRHAVRYAPSLATLAALLGADGADPQPGARRRPALVVGNPAMPTIVTASGRRRSLAPLPGAEREGRWVAQALGGELLTGDDASEAAVRARLGAAHVVHLATHGFAYSSDARALDSFIALAPGAGADGLLTVGELIATGPHLTVDLVVLSACQTGLGNLKQAEGTVGLQRAFLAKGARSVLVSLWSVSDEATELLMRRFYTHWLRDTDRPDKAEALRRAQRDVRAVPRFREPRYWAAFQLVGAA